MLIKKCFQGYKKILLITTAIIAAIIMLDFLCFCSYGYKDNSSGFLKFYFERYVDKSEKWLNELYINNSTNNNRLKYRSIENINLKNSSPVLLFGGTYMYGLFLNQNETFSYNLSKRISNPIYNRALPDSSASHLYYQLNNENFYNIVPKPKYIFYLYTPEQIIAMQTKLNFCQHRIYYRIKNSKLERYQKVPISKKNYIIALLNFNVLKYLNYTTIYDIKGEKLFNKLLVESKKEAVKHWGKDVNFIIIRYYKATNKIEDRIFKDLENKGFIIFNLYEYMESNNKNYYQKDSILPNAKALERAAEIISERFEF